MFSGDPFPFPFGRDSTTRRGLDSCGAWGGGVGRGALRVAFGVKPLAFALAIPALRRCKRPALLTVLRLPLLRLPRSDITAEISAFVGKGAVIVAIGLSDQGAFCMPSRLEM